MKRREFFAYEFYWNDGTTSFTQVEERHPDKILFREVLPGEDEMIQELVRAAEETLANTKGLTAKGDIPLIRALDKYKKWSSHD